MAQTSGNQVQTLRVQDFSGGLNTTVAPALLNNNEGQKADRVNYDQKGTIQPQKGRKKRYAAQFDASPVAGLGAFYTKAGTGSLLVAAGTTVYTDEPHMENVWDTQGQWTAAGTVAEGDLKTDRVVGSLMTTAGLVRQNEFQSITINGAPTGGAFTLTLSGQTTTALAYNELTLNVKNALSALSTVGGGANLIVTGATGGPWTVEFIGTLACTDVAQMTATSSLTGGTAPTVVVATVQAGFNTDIDLQYDTDAEFNAGTVTSLLVSANKLSLVKQGTDPMVYLVDTQADFNTCTLTQVSTTNIVGSATILRTP